MSKNNQSFFAGKLKQLRYAAKLTQTDLAKELNISRSCLANYEVGKRFPDVGILSIIADYFNVSIDYFLAEKVLVKPDCLDAKTNELLKEVAASGKLDISGISPQSKIALFEFYNFLDEQERNKNKERSI